MSKIVEKTVNLQLRSYLDEEKLLHNLQFGFRRRHSTQNALSKLLKQVSDAKNNNKHVLAMFIDVKKAFDSVQHDILLKKLEFYGLDKNALKWFESYLYRRKQKVKISGTYSKTEILTTSVPQGSILGPLLFIIYLNCLPNISKFCSILFADDTTLILTGPNLEELYETANEELKKLMITFGQINYAYIQKRAVLYTFTH